HLIVLDAPCSGSGTWGRHPEGKWRLTRRRLGEIAALQKRLLDRALSLLPPGGTVVYITCSLLRAENEQVVGDIMTSRSDAVELEVIQEGLPLKRGRPWGYYILPTLPWLDGFYIAIIMKR
ncbi:MAG TPA: RNA methyltransferase, partial [Thermosynergistes sp.]|nr:RNA methyltransferase [Thermosynergistes sp.]